MSKELRVPDYLLHILGAIERIRKHMSGIDRTGFFNNIMVQDAVVLQIEIIGEAANNIRKEDKKFWEEHQDIPWKVMYGMRNQVSHGYYQVDLNVVWETVQTDLPDLYNKVQQAKDGLNPHK